MPGKSLPALRKDLRFHRDPEGDALFIEDPLRNRFFRVPAEMAGWLTGREGETDADLQQRLEATGSAAPSDNDLSELHAFLRENQLLSNADIDDLSERAKPNDRSALSRLFHTYLFFRIPLFRPQRAIERSWRFVAPLCSRGFLITTIAAGLLGLWLAGRQWDAFEDTFSRLMTVQGAVLYGASLLLLKVLHEGGHAFMAHRCGVSVPRIGVAFIFMTPVLYTDTTAAWRLPRRDRMMIGAGGLLVELAIAAHATLAWALLPDGAARSVAFTLATLSWVVSLAVNLNPLMRFDGYYLFSDLIGVENLQQRGFALARWRLRETLFGWGEPPPEYFAPAKRRIVLLHAYATWIYRFFLFLGIALLIYHSVAKALGIALFIMEVGIFIVRPLWTELRLWAGNRSRFRINWHSLLSLSALAILLSILFLPWQGKIHAPAVMRAGKVWDLHMPVPARIDSVEETVAGGRRLLSITSMEPDRPFDHKAAMARHTLANRRYARIAADRKERNDRAIFIRQGEAAEAEMETLKDRASALHIVAPPPRLKQARLVWVSSNLHEGLWIAPQTPLATLVERGRPTVTALVPEAELPRLRAGSAVRFIPDEPERSVRHGRITEIAAAPLHSFDLPLLSSQYGGPVAVQDVPGLGPVPQKPHYAITIELDAPDEEPVRELRGIAILEADRQAPIARYLRHAAGVLIREFDF
ncbi:HlyD family efflux transporter periplasmic adaptor subunit [Notoacmeibacter ruber]|uniref:HlyD family efflux transporter periplasmic adaptor subunit n=1 Tax=Notoacmeibacter ruber TaxID=2670375 RepID=A0A3L7JBK5_9HYPH|nr:HlyD family efflux transporter periplasmic adaptor subunit [Notoacmeibacter ruber]RLQ88117.1 HlyD family efflux transporter periplasmic adaptor subunit [Notoacmeibacter ruber]